VGAIPILNHFIERMGLEEELSLALKNPGYANALLAAHKRSLPAPSTPEWRTHA
jgi:hypothetical protein